MPWIFPPCRNSGYNHDELRGSLYDNGRANIDAKYYDFSLNSQPELVKHDILEALGHKDITALPDFSSDNILRASSGLSFAREEPKFRNIPPLQSDMVNNNSHFCMVYRVNILQIDYGCCVCS